MKLKKDYVNVELRMSIPMHRMAKKDAIDCSMTFHDYCLEAIAEKAKYTIGKKK